MGALEKEIIAAGIAELEGNQLERAIEIIKTDTGQGENDSGELELDIEVLTENALTKLYDIAIKTFPHLRAEKEKTFAAPPQVETPSAKSMAACLSAEIVELLDATLLFNPAHGFVLLGLVGSGFGLG